MKAVITLSKTFFPQHPKAGQETRFAEKIGYAIWREEQNEICEDCYAQGYNFDCKTCTGAYRFDSIPKIHTCRSDYEYWKKKIDRLKAEGGVLSVRQWSEKPYRSPQETIVDIPAEIVGVQKLTIIRKYDWFEVIVDDKESFACTNILAKNDGLSTQDFIDWFLPAFKKAKTDVLELAIIHFTKYRY